MSDEVEEYVTRSVQMFLVDPPDTDYQCGFLAALLVLAKEALGLRMTEPPFAAAEGLCRSSEWMATTGDNPKPLRPNHFR
jgi:hypothetical protein